MFKTTLRLLPLTHLFLLPALVGCNIIGFAVQALPGRDVAAAYKGLREQKVGILVWADRGIAIDHPSIQPDIAKGLQKKLIEAANAGTDEVQKIQWVSADDVLRFQQAHPEMQFDPAEQLALKLPVTRLIYIEIVGLSLHPNDTPDLSRGVATASLKVVSVDNGKESIVYREDTIEAIYPPHAPPEGLPDIDDEKLYQQTTDTLTTEIAKRFITHEANAE